MTYPNISNMSSKLSQYYVIKRDGRRENVHFDKITQRISKLLTGNMNKNIDIINIVKKTITSIYPGITTKELDNQSAYQCGMMTPLHYDYALLAGRIYVSSLHKETMKTFVEKMELINDNLHIYDSEWIEFIKKHRNKLNKIIDYNRDYSFDFFGIKTMERTYITKLDGHLIERPQDVFMRVASLVHCGDLQKTIDSYNLMSKKYFTHASPTLFNAGNKKGNLVSCFLLGTEDSMTGISKTWNDVAHISKWGGGIGIHISNVRAKGSEIKSTNGHSDGIVPMLQVYNSICRYVNQSGRRKGSFAFYLEPHHADIFDFLELRKNTGAESERARDLFLALWVSDLFMNQVKLNNDWYLFCPDKAPGLNDVYGDEYETLYWKYVSEEKYNKKIKARKLWEAIMTAQFETGSPYMLYKDNINKKSNQKNIGIIRSSNLCAEIVEYSDSTETAACNLASIALPNFIKSKNVSDNGWIVYSKPNCIYCKWIKQMLINKNIKFEEKLIEIDSVELYNLKQKIGKELITFPQVFLNNTLIGGMEETWIYFGKDYDYEKLWNVAYHVTQNLDSVIDKNYYPTKESRRSNMRHRPIGLGIQGLADTLALLRVPYASKAALDINEKIFGIIYHAAVTASVDIAKEREEDMKLLLKYFEEHPKKKPSSEFYDDNFECYPKKIEKIYHKLRPHSTELDKTQFLGAYSTFEGSPFSEGKLQYHLWNRTPINISTLIEGKSWDSLINEMKKYGTRNSLLTALMPTASTSQLLGNYESFEPFTSNIYTRRTLAGEFIVVNKHLINDLNEIGEWTNEIRQKVINDNGSIQNILLPNIIKNIYQTSYEMKQKYIIDGCSIRGAYIDQTQSMNLYFAQPDSQKLTSSQFYAWEQGLKTGLYYLRSKPSANATKITVLLNNSQNKINSQNMMEEDEGCVMCSA
uniref:putative ribonucleotide reductase large subunit n=1 Tax=Cafeteria roenbergensis virus (strain BV-PW1) TaxID=693272 RepID=UPI0001E7AE98|nr:putative ribonucleotide reductase large subunit [Cafeteria roenbergensis virus BV-PW1]